MGKGCAQSGGGPIPAPLGFSGYISLHTNPFYIVHLTQLFILMDRMEPLILGLSKSRTHTCENYGTIGYKAKIDGFVAISTKFF
jgi:hypothetical protein